MAPRRKPWHTPQTEELPPYLIDVNTLARWLIVQCGSVREARKVVSDNADAARHRHRPLVPPHVICSLAEKIRATKLSYRGRPMSMLTAIQHAAKQLLKDRDDIAAAVQAARRMIKRGHWPLPTK
jgi:hypothetical protein